MLFLFLQKIIHSLVLLSKKFYYLKYKYKFILDNGSVCSFGYNTYGQLGLVDYYW